MNSIGFFVAAALAGSAPALVPAQSASQEQPAATTLEQREAITPRLTVQGNAELEKPADLLLISIGVVTEADEAQQALQNNSEKMRDVVDAIEDVGLGEDEYETGRFQLTPIYSQPPRRPQESWQRQITGYRVTNTITLRTQQLGLAGELIAAANEAGANSIDDIRFELADPRTHRAEAIREATRNAVEDAKVLAEAAGVRLARVLSINLDHAEVPRPMMQHRGMAAAMETDAAPPISPGDVTVHAMVTVVWEIHNEMRQHLEQLRPKTEEEIQQLREWSRQPDRGGR